MNSNHSNGDTSSSQTASGSRKSLKSLRFIFVLSGIGPLFVLWAFKGVSVISDYYFIPLCLILALVPNVIVKWKESLSKQQRHFRTITIGRAENQRHHVLVYLFAILLPFYRQDVTSWREFIALLVALVFILVLFWYLDLHYVNIIFAVRGYNAFAVHPAADHPRYARKDTYILITSRSNLTEGESIVALRLANDLYMEEKT